MHDYIYGSKYEAILIMLLLYLDGGMHSRFDFYSSFVYIWSAPYKVSYIDELIIEERIT